jgi:hypothetical protein
MLTKRQKIAVGLVMIVYVYAFSFPVFQDLLGSARAERIHTTFSAPIGKSCEIDIYPKGPIVMGRPATIQLEFITVTEGCDPSLYSVVIPGQARSEKSQATYSVRFTPQTQGSLPIAILSLSGTTLKRVDYLYRAGPSRRTVAIVEALSFGSLVALIVLLGLVIRPRSISPEAQSTSEPLQEETGATAQPAVLVGSHAKTIEDSGLPRAQVETTGRPEENSLIELLAQYGKIGSAIVVGLYISGLLVVNIYLNQWGASDFSLVKPRFIGAGAWFLGFLIIVVVPAAAVQSHLKLPATKAPNDGSLRYLLILAGAFVVYLLRLMILLLCASLPLILILVIAQIGLPLPSDRAIYVRAMIAIFILLMLGLMIAQAAGPLIKSIQPGAVREQSAAATGLILGGLIALTLFLLSAFSRGFYQSIPEGWGGGSLRVEELRFNKDLDADSVRELNDEFRCGGQQDGSVKADILFSGEDYVLILSPNGKEVLRMERKYISSEKWRNDVSYVFDLKCSNQ